MVTNIDKHDRLDPEPFSFRAAKDGRVMLYWHNKHIKTLAGAEVGKFLKKIAGLEGKHNCFWQRRRGILSGATRVTRRPNASDFAIGPACDTRAWCANGDTRKESAGQGHQRAVMSASLANRFCVKR